MGGKRQSNSFSLEAKPRKQVQYWLRLSTQTVSVGADGSTSPGYFTMAIMKTEEGVTTEMTTMPQGVTDGLAVEVYADGQLYVSFNDISDPTGLYQLFRSGNAGTDDWTVVSCMEFRLRARLTTVVYDTKTITAVPAGDDAVVYMLSAPQYVRFKYNHAGTPLAVDASLQLTLTKTVGNTSQRVLASLPQGMTLKTSTNGTAWTVAASQTLTRTVATDFSNGNQDTVWYGLFSGDTLLWSVGVQRRWEIQRMLMPAGEYQPKEYRQTVNTTPLVHCHVSDSLSEYWYLVGDTNDRGAGATPRYAPPSDQYPAIWEQASEFEVVLTKMLFADFARLGGFVVVGGFFFSQYGTLLYNNNGTVQAIGVDGSNYEAMFGGKVPYAWFDDTDPMAATSPAPGSYKFRPTKLMDALTGEEWMGEGRVHISDEGVEIEGSLTVSDTGNMYGTVVSITTHDWGNGIDFITREANGSTIVQRMQLCGGRGSQYVLPYLKLSTPIYVSGQETPAYDNYVKIDVNGIEMAYNHPTGSDIGASDEVLTIRHDTGLRIGIERKSKGSVVGSELNLSADGVLFQLLKFEKVDGHMTMQYPYQDSLGGTGWNSVRGYGYLTLATGKYLLLYCGMVIGVSTTRPGSGWTQMDAGYLNPDDIL